MRALLVQLSLLLLLASCSQGNGEGQQQQGPASKGRETKNENSAPAAASRAHAEMWAGLCRTLSLAHDPGRAREPFYDLAHEDLHRLADRLRASHPARAARLLEAKQEVEAGLEEDRARGLKDDIKALIKAARGGTEALGKPAPSC